jgi:hypothetical protein
MKIRRNIRNIRHEQKDQNGRTLFALDVQLYEEQMTWFEGTFMYAFEDNDEQVVKSDDHLSFLHTRVVVHLPLDPIREVELTKEVLHKIDKCLKKDQHADITSLLKELCELIMAVENIAWIYTPNFALDENGSYDDSFIIKELEKGEHPILQSFSPLESYTEYLLNKTDNHATVISDDSHQWLFNCLRFLFHFMPSQFPAERIGMEQIINEVEDEIRDYVLDLSSLPGYFMVIRHYEKGKEEVFYAFCTMNDEPLCYFTGIEE